MYCPVCNHQDTKVVDSRMSSEGSSIRRRRECEACGYRFSTNEEVELLDLVVIKRDGTRQAYSREKLEGGVRRSMEKRPMTEASFRVLIHEMERDIQRQKTDEITSAQLGELVMNRLKGFDKIAYIRFASVYRQFEDVESFTEALASLTRKPKKNALKKKR